MRASLDMFPDSFIAYLIKEQEKMTQPPVVADKQLVGPLDLTDEAYREYEIPGRADYRINDPQQLYYRIGGTTHRVVDSLGVTHCIPAPTAANGVVLRWRVRDGKNPVQF